MLHAGPRLDWKALPGKGACTQPLPAMGVHDTTEVVSAQVTGVFEVTNLKLILGWGYALGPQIHLG